MKSPPSFIPFNRFCASGTEGSYIQQAFEAIHVSGCGRFTAQCEELLGRIVPGARAVLTTSCTSALEMAALLGDLQPGDEVIVPSFTFVSTAAAFALRGVRPVFADIRADTLNLDETLLDRHIHPRTRYVVPVHYAGVACEMDAIIATASHHGMGIIEDSAHGLFGTYKGRALGSFGRFATQSFHETKNISCGEGGALLLNDPADLARAEIIRDKGTDRGRFLRGGTDKYTWVDLGSSFCPSEILAAVLYAQLEVREAIQRSRHRIWNRYAEALAAWASGNGVRLPFVPAHCEHPAHLFYLLLPSLAARTRFLDELRGQQILSVFHYQPLHTSPMGRRFGGKPGDCPVAESAADRLVRLPLFNHLTETEQDRIIDAILLLRL